MSLKTQVKIQESTITGYMSLKAMNPQKTSHACLTAKGRKNSSIKTY